MSLDDAPLAEDIDDLTQSGMQETSAWLYLARPLAPGQTLAIETASRGH